MRLPARAVGQEGVVSGVGSAQVLGERIVDLIGGARDARPDRGDDALDACAERVSIAAIAWSVTPATAPRQPAWAAAITPASRVGEQHRGAVGGDDAKHQSGRSR